MSKLHHYLAGFKSPPPPIRSMGGFNSGILMHWLLDKDHEVPLGVHDLVLAFERLRSNRGFTSLFSKGLEK